MEREICIRCGRPVQATEEERELIQLEILREYAPDIFNESPEVQPDPPWQGEDGG